VLGVVLAIPQAALAHPPSDMQLRFDEASGVISVTITHPVTDPSTHYVKRVLIQQGGTVIQDTPYMSQPSPQTFTNTYPLPPGVSGEITVRVECAIGGSLTRSLPITRTTTPPTVSPTVSPTSPGTVLPGTTATSATSPATPAPLGALAVLAVWWSRR